MKKTYHIDGRTFICNAMPNCGVSGMAEVEVRELVRPHWKIFRTRYIGSNWFWVEDYETIDDGIYDILRNFIEKDNVATMIAEKWKNFLNRKGAGG